MKNDTIDSGKPVPFYHNMMVELFKTEIKFLEDMTALKKYLKHLTDKSKIDPKVIEPIKHEIGFIIKAINDYTATSFAVDMNANNIEHELKKPEFLRSSGIKFEESAPIAAKSIIGIALNCSQILTKTALNKELANALEKEFQQFNKGSTNGRTFNSEVIKSVQRIMRFTMPFDEAYKALQKQDVGAMQKENEKYGRVEFAIFTSKFDQLFKSSIVSDRKLKEMQEIAKDLEEITRIKEKESKPSVFGGSVLKSLWDVVNKKPVETGETGFEQTRASLQLSLAATKKQENPNPSSTSAKIPHSRGSENSSKSVSPLSTLKNKIFGKNQ